MSKYNNLPKSLPPTEIPFSIKVKGNRTGNMYEGDFIVKVPTVGAQSRVGVILAQLGMGIPFEQLDRLTGLLNNAIAYLRVNLHEAPEWFTDEEGMDYGFNTLDSNVAIEIFNAATKKVEEWYEQLNGEKTTKKPSKR